jgi:hypothetical protein
MTPVIGRLFERIDSHAVEREVEEELHFHLDMLEEHFQHAKSSTEARASALKRFGDVERVKDQCVEISKRKRPLTRVLKSFLILVFLAGIFVRIFGTDLHVVRVGVMLITIAVVGRLFLYVCGLKPSSFRPKSDASSPLMLNSTAKTPTSLFEATTFSK